MANLYTKTGDKGQTSLVGGSRVSKSSLRVECYGTIDEANSMLGLAYAQTDREYIRTTVHHIQGRLFALGAELASDEQGARSRRRMWLFWRAWWTSAPRPRGSKLIS